MSYLGKRCAVPKTDKKKKAKSGGGVSVYGRRFAVLEKNFSLFIRLRDCGDDSRGYAKCISCGSLHYFRDMDAGHFVVRGFKPTRFDERNVNAQCIPCNRELTGNVDNYAAALGSELVELLDKKSRELSRKIPLYQVEKMIVEYREKVKIEAIRVGVEIR